MTSNVNNKKSLSVFKIINTYFLKNKVALIVSLTTPLIFMIIFYSISISFKASNFYTVYGKWDKFINFGFFTNTLPVFLTFSICPISLLCIPNMNIEFKNSIILKNIKSNQISKYKYNGILFGYFMLVSFIVTIITFIFFFLFLISNYNALEECNWLSIIFGVLCLMISSVTFSMFIGNFIKSSIGAQILGISIMILSIGLCGRFMDIGMIDQIKPIKYINFLSPLGCSQNSISMGTFNSFKGNYKGRIFYSSNNVFNFTKDQFYWYWDNLPATLLPEIVKPDSVNILFYKKPLIVYHKWEKVLDVFVPFIMSGMYFYLSLHFFKWTNR